MNLANRSKGTVIRKYYYTSAQGDDNCLISIEGELKDMGIEAPQVFKKSKGRGSKRVDISLTTEMLTHAHRGNYDVAILVAGDEDYVPLVEAVKAEGRRVALWYFDTGLSDVLQRKADFFFNIGEVLLNRDSGGLTLKQVHL